MPTARDTLDNSPFIQILIFRDYLTALENHAEESHRDPQQPALLPQPTDLPWEISAFIRAVRDIEQHTKAVSGEAVPCNIASPLFDWSAYAHHVETQKNKFLHDPKKAGYNAINHKLILDLWSAAKTAQAQISVEQKELFTGAISEAITTVEEYFLSCPFVALPTCGIDYIAEIRALSSGSQPTTVAADEEYVCVDEELRTDDDERVGEIKMQNIENLQKSVAIVFDRLLLAACAGSTSPQGFFGTRLSLFSIAEETWFLEYNRASTKPSAYLFAAKWAQKDYRPCEGSRDSFFRLRTLFQTAQQAVDNGLFCEKTGILKLDEKHPIISTALLNLNSRAAKDAQLNKDQQALLTQGSIPRRK